MGLITSCLAKTGSVAWWTSSIPLTKHPDFLLSCSDEHPTSTNGPYNQLSSRGWRCGVVDHRPSPKYLHSSPGPTQPASNKGWRCGEVDLPSLFYLLPSASSCILPSCISRGETPTSANVPSPNLPKLLHFVNLLTRITIPCRSPWLQRQTPLSFIRPIHQHPTNPFRATHSHLPISLKLPRTRSVLTQCP
jgi:hypothetical protein